MTFRSDEDAKEERLRTLEKQLEDARRELSVLRPKADRLDIAEKENKRLMAEIARSSGASPVRRGMSEPVRGPSSKGPSASVALLIALVVLLFGGLAAFFVFVRASSTASEAAWAAEDRARREEEAREDAEAAAQQARIQAELARSQAAAEEAEREMASILGSVPATAEPVAPEPAVDPSLLVDRSVDFAPIIRAARVVDVTGDAPVARRAHCQLTLTAEDGDCRAEVMCGHENLYPRTGSGGFFHCQVEDHVVHTGRDANPTPRSGDPRLELDADARSITISDGPPEWSVRLTYDAH